VNNISNLKIKSTSDKVRVKRQLFERSSKTAKRNEPSLNRELIYPQMDSSTKRKDVFVSDMFSYWPKSTFALIPLNIPKTHRK
jgi:hypothetical protein